ncbi:MAG: hypothetical protein GY805_37850 [Chloroflexi bacterium]|nr:hypothetical protein [Chloroflexota bacterium]
MPKIKVYSLSFWTAVILVLALNAIIFSVTIMAASNGLKVQYIPDDAYYYLTLAQNFSTLGSWTFDSGVSITSGFHPLFAYLLSSAFSLLPLDANSFVICGIIFGLLFTLTSITVMWFWGFKHKNVLFLMFLALVISSRNFILNIVSITEWSLTLLIASLYCVWFFTKYGFQNANSKNFIVLFALGLLGSTARSDFGLLPFSIVAATFVLTLTIIPSKKPLLFAFVGLLGTLTGLIILFAHNYIFTNEFLQSSAKMKAHWSQLSIKHDWIDYLAPYLTTPLLIGQVVSFAGLLLLGALIGATILPKFIKRKTAVSLNSNKRAANNHHSSDKFIILIAAAVSVLGYTLLYAHNAAIQPWYTVNLIVPVLMLIFSASEYITISLREKARVIFSLLFLLAAVFNVANLYPITAVNARWPHQKLMFEAGVYLRENSPGSRIGAWNAGIIGYYEGGRIVNLDGLVNNDIYTYAVNNDLPDYLSSENINYIIDFENMLSKSRRIKGGYDDAEFLANLKPQKVFDNSEYYWKHLTLYRIDKAD